MFYSLFPHISDAARVALTGVTRSCLHHLDCLPDEEMRSAWVTWPLLWVGEAAGRAPFIWRCISNTKESSSVNGAGIQGGLVPRQDSMFLTCVFVPVFWWKKLSERIPEHVMGGFHRPGQSVTCSQPTHGCHSQSIYDYVLAPKFLVSSQAGYERNIQCCLVPYLPFKECVRWV